MKSVGLLSSNLPRVIDRSDSRNADSRNGDSRNKQVTTATAVSHAFPWCVQLSSNIPGFLSVDLIGENNQVILE